MLGKIYRIALNKGFGFIRGEDNHSYFFHAREVLPSREAFDLMSEGQAVTFEPTNSGPENQLRAHYVRCIVDA